MPRALAVSRDGAAFLEESIVALGQELSARTRVITCDWHAIESFADSLSANSIPLTLTAADEAVDELAALIEPPVIGTQLPYDGVSLPENVTTDLSPSVLESAAVGITPATLAIAEYGSVVISDDGGGSEHVSLFADEHVAVVAASDVVASMGSTMAPPSTVIGTERSVPSAHSQCSRSGVLA